MVEERFPLYQERLPLRDNFILLGENFIPFWENFILLGENFILLGESLVLLRQNFILVGENSIHWRELYSQKFKWTVKLISMKNAAANSTLAELGAAHLSLFFYKFLQFPTNSYDIFHDWLRNFFQFNTYLSLKVKSKKLN